MGSGGDIGHWCDISWNLKIFFWKFPCLGWRIYLDKIIMLPGFGFVTFDSQNVAETVRDMERVKFNEECEVVIGPARIRKKRFYLLPGTNGWNAPQPCYFQVTWDLALATFCMTTSLPPIFGLIWGGRSSRILKKGELVKRGTEKGGGPGHFSS